MFDGYLLNKWAGALLFALLIAFGLNELSHVAFQVHDPQRPAYMADAVVVAAAAPVERTVEPLPLRLAAADAASGARTAGKCVACHSFEKDGRNKIGPHLWGVVGRRIAAIADFSYSSGLIERNREGDVWTYAALDAFLDNPRDDVPGTKMSFRGLRDADKRADFLAWLNEQADNRVPYPTE